MNKIKKHLISYLGLLSFLAIGLFPNYSFADLINPFESGTGLENDPFIIMTCEQLQEMNYHDVEGEISYPYLTSNYYFKLGDNIDCSATVTWNEKSEGSGEYYGFMPIGGTYDTTGEGQGYGASFVGYFDGNNKTISGLYINRPTFHGVGLFGYVNEIILENLTLDNLSISGQDETGGVIGSVNESSLLNISTSGQIVGNDNVGGLVGRTNGTHIEGSNSSSQVSGIGNIGGLVGQNNSSVMQTIQSSFSTGSIIGQNNVGGLIGENNGDTITSSYATGDISFDFDYLEDVVENYGLGGFDAIPFNFGGLIGVNNNGHIEDSYATGIVSGIANVGGLIGGNIFMEEPSTVINSYATGDVIGLATSGGLIGYNVGDTIEDSYAIGSVSFNEILRDNIILIASGLEIEVEGLFDGDFNIFGGLVGINEGGHIENTYAEGNVEGIISGGLVGQSVGGRIPFTITNSHATGTVISNGFAAGGLVGANMGDTITNSYATGDVIGNYVSMSELVGFGGLVGVNMSGHIENTYAEGNVEGIITGGLIGVNMGSSPFLTIINSYSRGNIEGSIVGGLVGMNMEDQIYNSYFVGSVTGVGSEAFDMIKGMMLGIGEEVDSIAAGFIGAIMIGEGDTIEDWVFNSGWNLKDNQDLSSIAFVQYETAEDPIVELNVSSSQIVEVTNLSSLYTKDHPIYNSGDETQWQWNGNPWYEYTNNYPKFTEQQVVASVRRTTSSGSFPSRITTVPIVPEQTPEQEVCLPGHIFNPLTGERCLTPENEGPADCQTGFIFSPSTGQSCLTTSNENNQEQLQNIIQRTLRQGMTGEDVLFLQTYLNSKGYDSGIQDGKFGPKTKQAVIFFQLANNLTGDGIVGPKTREMIK